MFTRIAALFLLLTLFPPLARAFHDAGPPMWAMAGSSCVPASPALPLYATSGSAATMRRHAFTPRDAFGVVHPVILRCPVTWQGTEAPPWNTLALHWNDSDDRDSAVWIIVRLVQAFGADSRVVAVLDSRVNFPPIAERFQVTTRFAGPLLVEHVATYVEVQLFRLPAARAFAPPKLWQVRLETARFP